jgi:hypothetical protein
MNKCENPSSPSTLTNVTFCCSVLSIVPNPKSHMAQPVLILLSQMGVPNGGPDGGPKSGFKIWVQNQVPKCKMGFKIGVPKLSGVLLVLFILWCYVVLLSKWNTKVGVPETLYQSQVKTQIHIY